MPTLILPDGSSRWIAFDAHESFIKDLKSFYGQLTSDLNTEWNTKTLRLRDGGIDPSDIASVERYLVESFDTSGMFALYGRLIRGLLIDANIATWRTYVKKSTVIPDSIVVPTVLDEIAQLYHNERAGRTGKGEFLIPILFKDAVWNSHEAIYDVSINGKPWHVKAIKRQNEPAKLNRCGYANGEVCKQLSRFMSASQLSAGYKSTGVLANLEDIRKLNWFDGDESDRDILLKFQKVIDDEMRSLSIDEAEGVIFYLEPERKFIFKRKHELYCSGATQSNHQVSIVPNFFVGTYDRLEAVRVKKEEKEAARRARIATRLAKKQAKEQEAAARLARKIERQEKQAQYKIDNALAKAFLTQLREAWKHSNKRKARPNPSFAEQLALFVEERDLDYQYFYSFLMDNSSCQKTFQKLQTKCS